MKYLLLSMALLFTAGCLEEVKTDLKTDEGRAKISEKIAGAGETVSMIPHPYAQLAGGALLIASTILGHKKGKKSGLQHGLGVASHIVDAIEQVKDTKGKVDFKDEETRAELNRLMGAEHKKIVSDVQGK